jgi:4-hydroxybenzoate polyprenyltransferase
VLEARPPIIMLFALRMIVATGFAQSGSTRALVLTLAWTALTIAAYVYNGVKDLPGDRFNGSTRPLATGRLSVRTASCCALGLALAGLVGCWSLSPALGMLGFASLALGWAYSAGPALKRSSIACALCVFLAALLTYTAGSLVATASNGERIGLAVWSLWIGLVSVCKDFSDVEGDLREGRRTLPVSWGVSAAARLTLAMALSGAVALVVTAETIAPRLAPASWVALAGSVMVAARLARLRTGDRHQLRAPYRMFVATQFAVNLAAMVCTF